MKSPYSFLVTPINDRRYNNIKKIGEIDFITSTSEEDHKSSNRFAKVKATPLGYEGEIKEGDILSFRNAGAYCYSMASNYNSRYKPAEVLWMNGEGHLIRAHETFEDLLKNQIPLPATATV